MTLLMAAVCSRSVNKVRMIGALTRDFCFRDPGGRTALTFAVLGNCTEIIATLIEMEKMYSASGKCAAVDLGDTQGYTPFMWAVGKPSKREALRLLLLGGADIRAVDRTGLSAMDWAVRIGDGPCIDLMRAMGMRPPVFKDVQSDISQGQERIPIPWENTLDSEVLPPFAYVSESYHQNSDVGDASTYRVAEVVNSLQLSVKQGLRGLSSVIDYSLQRTLSGGGASGDSAGSKLGGGAGASAASDVAAPASLFSVLPPRAWPVTSASTSAASSTFGGDGGGGSSGASASGALQLPTTDPSRSARAGAERLIVQTALAATKGGASTRPDARGCNCIGGLCCVPDDGGGDAGAPVCKCASASFGGVPPYKPDGSLSQRPGSSSGSNSQPLIIECNSRCACAATADTRAACPMRVSQRGIAVPLVAFKTRNRGWGLKAAFPIAQGSFVLCYVGEILDKRDMELREEEYVVTHPLFSYVVHVSQGSQSYAIDATNVSNAGRLINHSCNPNLEMRKVAVDTKYTNLAMFARRNISAGEELTWRYEGPSRSSKREQTLGKRMQCLCGEANCVKFF
jgi:hypothetical protein